MKTYYGTFKQSSDYKNDYVLIKTSSLDRAKDLFDSVYSDSWCMVYPYADVEDVPGRHALEAAGVKEWNLHCRGEIVEAHPQLLIEDVCEPFSISEEFD